MTEAGEFIYKTPHIFLCSEIIHLNERNILLPVEQFILNQLKWFI